MRAQIERYKKRFKIILIPMDDKDKKEMAIFKDLTLDTNSPSGEIHLDVGIIKPSEEDNPDDDEYKFTTNF